MSSQWTERQGHVGELRKQSREELVELLLRQERILSNKRFLQSLPDKGKRISEFADKIRLAIDHYDEEDRRQNLVSAARTELQSKYQQALSKRKPGAANTPAASDQSGQSEMMSAENETSPVLSNMQEQDMVASTAPSGKAMETAAAGASLNSEETKENDLVTALERVRVSETSTSSTTKSKESSNPFLRVQTAKKYHYETVLEKIETTSAVQMQKYKPNQLPHRGDISPSESLSPGNSSQGMPPLSVQARRERDKKHMDDITAARLLPLHHSPARLLSLEESAVLVKEQTRKHQELQDKQAAQKLSEGSMGIYSPDSGPMAAYREVHDEAAMLSSEED